VVFGSAVIGTLAGATMKRAMGRVNRLAQHLRPAAIALGCRRAS
jgi:hypothetical protein